MVPDVGGVQRAHLENVASGPEAAVHEK
jgi:hypothetical protein